MTDKEIIIDGVDVSKCPAMNTYNVFGQEDKPCCYKWHKYCNTVPNCYFKQLKRKEQECEELKEKIKKYSKINEQDTKDFAKLKQECKNLEEELRGCRIGIKDISIENTEICKISEKSKRVIDDIEKQVKAMNNECFYDDICDCNNCDMKNGCSYYRKFNILNIINKVKEK